MLLKSSKAADAAGAASAAAGETGQRLKLYLLATAMLVVAAVIVVLIPKGTPLQQCKSLFAQQDRYSCINQLAFSSNNASLCSRLPGSYSSTCYAGIAERSGNASMCGEAMPGNASAGSLCFVHFANMTGNASLCTNAAEPYRLGCVTSISVRLSNSSACGLLGQQNASVCSSAVHMSEAIAYGRAGLCGYVSNSTGKQAELGILNNTPALASLNSTVSYMLTYLYAIPNESYSPRDLCYLSVASKTFNSSICSKIYSSQAEQLCMSVSSKQSVTPQSVNASQALSTCREASAYMDERQCIAYLTLSESIATDNITWCTSLGSDYYDTCYSSFASAFHNATYCSYISNVTANNACIANMSYNASKTP